MKLESEVRESWQFSVDCFRFSVVEFDFNLGIFVYPFTVEGLQFSVPVATENRKRVTENISKWN
jgi:hypothetical protein